MPPHTQLTPPTKVIGSPSSSTSYTPRSAVRIIAFNPQGHIAILHAARDNYYKLPGGGVEPGEDHETAARREFLEETGGVIRLRRDLKYNDEFRLQQCQTSYCYVADLVSDTGRTALEEEEVEDGLKHMWVSLDEARRLVEGAVPGSEFGRSVREREMHFLREIGRVLGS
ncbi:uncharacterized protein C8A04DRAFT_40561 [Dichotomopilus funicola]|uniref:Nudix hydrolase domain-containing protein n=1 Tax=Dichotomopilus funicola TaxID=1934379 RepID=A0AAN6UVC6_9PEZI|nr:hypothetical protein C8A04DRAFT_40561 [Dichotomopilus funicola]